MKLAIAMMAMLAVWPFSSAKEYQMTPGIDVPAAAGTVRIEKDKDNGDQRTHCRRLAKVR